MQVMVIERIIDSVRAFIKTKKEERAFIKTKKEEEDNIFLTERLIKTKGV